MYKRQPYRLADEIQQGLQTLHLKLGKLLLKIYPQLLKEDVKEDVYKRQLLAQPVGGKVVPVPSCFFQAADAPVRITDFKIVRESSLSRAYCASGNPCFAAWVSQYFALWLSGISRRPSR